MPKILSPAKEKQFQEWYRKVGPDRFSLRGPNPDDPRHHYNYRDAWLEGITGPDVTGHWPSKHKLKGHPRLIINGVDTRINKAIEGWRKEEKKNPRKGVARPE